MTLRAQLDKTGQGCGWGQFLILWTEKTFHNLCKSNTEESGSLQGKGRGPCKVSSESFLGSPAGNGLRFGGKAGICQTPVSSHPTCGCHCHHPHIQGSGSVSLILLTPGTPLGKSGIMAKKNLPCQQLIESMTELAYPRHVFPRDHWVLTTPGD